MPTPMPLPDLRVPAANREGLLSPHQSAVWSPAARTRRLDIAVSGLVLGCLGLVLGALPLITDAVPDRIQVMVVWLLATLSMVGVGFGHAWRMMRPGGDDLTRDLRDGIVDVVRGELSSGVVEDDDLGGDEYWIALGRERFVVEREIWPDLGPARSVWSAWVLPRTRLLVSLEPVRGSGGDGGLAGEHGDRALSRR